jgi:hypothetical protein
VGGRADAWCKPRAQAFLWRCQIHQMPFKKQEQLPEPVVLALVEQERSRGQVGAMDERQKMDRSEPVSAPP